ncbi:MAG: hypothetical protein RLZZ303_529 [Candidatus Hydrogenedentota bacterium]
MGSREGRFSRMLSGARWIRGIAGVLAFAAMAGLSPSAEAQCITISRSFPQLAYAGGETQFPVEVTISSTCDDVFAIGLREVLPAGWIWKGVAGDEADLPDWNTLNPTAGGTVEYVWIPVPQFPITFTYFVEIPELPEGQDGQDQNITGSALFRVKDGAQQISTASSTVKYVRPPTISLVGSQTVLLACGDTYTELGATAIDPAEGDITNRIQISGEVNTQSAGTYVITYGVTNAFEQTVSVQRVVTVTDTAPPEITLLGDETIIVECGTPFNDPGASAVDVCQGNVTPQRTGSVNNRVPGTYLLSYVATDNGGNSSSPVTRTVIVRDTRAPIITLLGGSSVPVECGSPFVDPGFTANDTCEGDLSANVVRNASQVNTSRAGTYTVTYNLVDANGNRATQVTRTVVVSDTTRPTITLQGGASLTLECGTTYTDPGATASDACAGALPVSVNTSALNMNVPGTYTVRYSATDGVTQARTATRTVNVVDRTAPRINLVGDEVLFVECGSAYTELGGTVTDSCERDLSLLISGATVYTNQPGSYRVKYSTEDGSGNRDEASRLVIVQDSTPPEMTLLGASTVTVECTTAFTDPGATAVDTCDGDLTSTIVVGGDRIVASVPGEYVVTYTATDAAGNAATALTRTVRVVDTRAPEMRLNGGDVTLFCGEEYEDLGASANDDCDGSLTAAITVEGAGINTDVPGTYLVNYSVRDAAGNRSQVTRTVTVLEAGCEEEGEGEGSPAEGEGEGDVELPACAPESVSLISPVANVLVPVGTTTATVDLQAQVRFASEVDCELPANVTVLYAIDGVLVGSSTNAAGGYPVQVSLGLGEYVLSVTALPTDRSTAVSTVRPLSVLEARDADANGILDNPFSNLPGDGDFWSASVSAAGCDRAVVLQSWSGDETGGTIEASLVNPANTEQSVLIRVNRALLQPGEQGVLIANFSCDLPSLFDPYKVDALIDALPAGPIAGQAYLDLSIIVSSDGGATYTQLEQVEVDGQPAVELTYLSSGLARGSTFRAYPSTIESTDTGLRLRPASGAWTRQGVENVVSLSGRLSAKLRHLSTFGAFVAVDLPADLSADRDALNFGSLVQGGSRELSVTITNSGDSALNGSPLIEGAGFSLLDDSPYTLNSGQSRTITVRFSPNGVRGFSGTLRLSGGAGGDVTIALNGTGTLFDKGASATGCGSNAPLEGRAGDILLVSALLALLAWSSRKRMLKG